MRKGTKVTWKYGTGTAAGKIHETYTATVTHQLQGATITRHGTPDNPAYLIVQEDGARVLKLASEVQPA